VSILSRNCRNSSSRHNIVINSSCCCWSACSSRICGKEFLHRRTVSGFRDFRFPWGPSANFFPRRSDAPRSLFRSDVRTRSRTSLQNVTIATRSSELAFSRHTFTSTILPHNAYSHSSQSHEWLRNHRDLKWTGNFIQKLWTRNNRTFWIQPLTSISKEHRSFFFHRSSLRACIDFSAISCSQSRTTPTEQETKALRRNKLILKITFFNNISFLVYRTIKISIKNYSYLHILSISFTFLDIIERKIICAFHKYNILICNVFV